MGERVIFESPPKHVHLVLNTYNKGWKNQMVCKYISHIRMFCQRFVGDLRMQAFLFFKLLLKYPTISSTWAVVLARHIIVIKRTSQHARSFSELVRTWFFLRPFALCLTGMASWPQRRMKICPIFLSYVPKCFEIFILDSEFWILDSIFI
jgi:hypothetical protein